MSTHPEDPTPLLCELGWHRPDPIARWNDGYYFAKCLRCRRDLVRTAYGQWQVPKGYRVVWQQKPPETREDVTLLPADAAAGGAPMAVQVSVAAVAPASQESPEPAAEPEPIAPAVPDVSPQAEGPPAAPASAPELTTLQSAPEPETIERASAVKPVEPESPELIDQMVLDDVPQPDVTNPAASAAVVPETPARTIEPPVPDHRPIEELLHEANGAAAPVAESAPPAPVAEEPEQRPASGRNELPIEEVLRHLQSTPLPQDPLDEHLPKPLSAQDEERPAEPEVEEPVAAVEGNAVAEQPLPAEKVAETTDLAEAEAEVQPVRHAVGTATYMLVSSGGAAMLQRDLPEPHFDPHVEPLVAPAPAAPASPPPADPEPRELKPIPTFSSDWDFMQEDEPDPIGSFWEDPGAPPSSRAPEPEIIDTRAVEPTPEPSEAPAAEAGAETVQPPAPEAPPVAEPVEQEMAPSAAESSEEPTESAAPIPALVATEFTDPFAASAEPQLDSAVAYEAPEPALPPLERTQPAAAPITPAAQVDAVETPPWVDQIGEGDGEEEAPRSRTPRMAVTALLSVGVLALMATLASQPRRDGPPAQQKQPASNGSTIAAAAPSTRETPAKPAPVRAGKVPKHEPDGSNGARPFASSSLPALPGREAAFVVASVLQCRSAPVEASAPVRKLVRGAQVQILAREGQWTSVAYKGRQCWASGRFLSATQPW